MARDRRGGEGKKDPATESFDKGCQLIEKHPIFGHMGGKVFRRKDSRCPPGGWAVVSGLGSIDVHPTRRGTPEEWAYVIAHCRLHLALGHLRRTASPVAWNTACDLAVAKFLADLKFGKAPEEMLLDPDIPATSEERLYQEFRTSGIPPQVNGAGAAGPTSLDMVDIEHVTEKTQKEWQASFVSGIDNAVEEAVGLAAGRTATPGAKRDTPAQRARSWFISSYPLLGSLAASFDLIEDPLVCQRMQISVAAVNEAAREIYVNPGVAWDEEALRFVLAHEMLHVGLRHQSRCAWRDPYLWNVACDFVINGWLLEMGVGVMPELGGLHDPQLKGLSAEAIYDRIVTDLRRYRKLLTFRGAAGGDMLGAPAGASGAANLDDFYRRCLAEGLSYHQSRGRGLLPAGLVEEIRALDHPPIPWDVELAQWFDEHFSPLEKRRSFARPNRRQSSTPDIPRPSWVPAAQAEDSRTFGVVLDTSGSMDRVLLARALGAIASYSIARDVARARVVFCDAHPYDEGYMSPDAIAGRVRVRGRGGTVLQPGVDLLQEASDFPKEGPILIITDAQCDRLTIKRDHAFLTPEGAHLPFVPWGKVFRIS